MDDRRSESEPEENDDDDDEGEVFFPIQAPAKRFLDPTNVLSDDPTCVAQGAEITAESLEGIWCVVPLPDPMHRGGIWFPDLFELTRELEKGWYVWIARSRIRTPRGFTHYVPSSRFEPRPVVVVRWRSRSPSTDSAVSGRPTRSIGTIAIAIIFIIVDGRQENRNGDETDGRYKRPFG